MHRKLYCLVDTEATGLNKYNDKVFDIGLIITDGKIRLNEFYKPIYIDSIYVEEAIRNLGHKISIDANKIANADKPITVYTQFVNLIKSYVAQYENAKLFFVAHNVDYDYDIIKSNLKKINYELENEFKLLFADKVNVIDTVSLARKIFSKNNIASFSLNNVGKYIIENQIYTHISKLEYWYNQRMLHSAEIDVNILFEIFFTMLKINPIALY